MKFGFYFILMMCFTSTLTVQAQDDTLYNTFYLDPFQDEMTIWSSITPETISFKLSVFDESTSPIYIQVGGLLVFPFTIIGILIFINKKN